MRTFYNSILIVLFSFLYLNINAQSCQQNKNHQNGGKTFTPDEHQNLASNLRSDTVDILNYTINLNITDFTTNVIKGNTQVKFTPKINGVTKLNLDFLMLTVDSIKVGATLLTSSYNDTLLQINLPITYNINDTATATVYYHGTPQGDASGWGGFYFQSGYAYNLGVGFAALPHNYGRVWYPCFDNFVERATYEFNITTNGGKISACNGYLANETTDGSGNRTRKWILNKTIPSYLACVAVASYATVHESYSGIAGTIPIELEAVATDTAAVKSSFINLPVALSTFENHFGAYKWNKVGYSMVPFNSGAMEHATNIGYPKATATGSTAYQYLFAHELSHHWFGDLATCRTAEDMWLNEGWAHYCEFLFWETLNGYPSYLSYVRNNHLANLQFLVPKEGNLKLSNIPQTVTYGDHVYNKGADVAHTMRGYMGDSLFFYSVKTYLANNNYKDVSSADFRDALTAASGMDMTDFFNDWVFNPGWPHFSIDSSVVVPSGPNYSVTVYVKQKLTGAPAYYTNVPLEVTFKAANFVEQTKAIMMSGANMSFNFTVPFNPAFVAINMGEKISHAVAPEYKIIKTTGGVNFPNAKMNLTVSSITDSAFVRIEHNYTAPDPFHTYYMPYRLSPNHYWKVDGILPATFKAKATINYEGRTLGFNNSYYQDNNLINTYEDSLVLMYRQNAADDWHVYPYYTRNFSGSNNDKHGLIIIDTLQLGEYVFAMMDYTMGIQNHPALAELTNLKVYPNPAKDNITVDIYASFGKAPANSVLSVTDISGKIIFKEKLQQQNTMNINTSAFTSGVYFISIKSKDELIAKSKFVVAH
jgi:hypothetical protein